MSERPHPRPDEILDALRGVRVLVVGDLCLDEYRYGAVGAIAKEAPVACLDEGERVLVPGQAANVAANLAALGAEVRVTALSGRDEAGARLRRLLEERGVYLDGVLETGRPTTERLKLVATSPDEQHVFHSYRESRAPLDPDGVAALTARLETSARGCDSLVLSDYGNGVIGPELRERARRLGIPWVVDTRGELEDFSGAACLKPNEREVELWWRRYERGEAGMDEKAERCRRELGLRWLCLTLGSGGLDLFHEDGRESRPALCPPHLVRDHTGAGDTVSAVLGLALAGGLDPARTARLAALAAADVVSRPGTSTPWPRESR